MHQSAQFAYLLPLKTVHDYIQKVYSVTEISNKLETGFTGTWHKLWYAMAFKYIEIILCILSRMHTEVSLIRLASMTYNF